tara:strand:- start:202 stop:834 length:633 start_codon:yes stop_codon:yes gene_type:complete
MHVSSLELKQILQEEVHGEIALVVLGRRIKELKELDYSKQQINEDILDTLGGLGKGFMGLSGGLSGAAKESVIEFVVEKIAGIFNIRTEGLLAGTVKFAISNMTMDDWQAAIAGDCERIAKILQRALIEHLLDRVIRKTSRIIGLSLRKQLGVSPTTLDQLLGESVERMIRNLVEGYLFNTEFMQKMTKTISEKICEIDLADAFQGAFSE